MFGGRKEESRFSVKDFVKSACVIYQAGAYIVSLSVVYVASEAEACMAFRRAFIAGCLSDGRRLS